MTEVCYTANGHWRPSIPGQICAQCGATYTAHSCGQKFCSKRCSGLSRRGARVVHTEPTCPGCGKVWTAPPSNPSRYCSKSCIFESGHWRKPEYRDCKNCSTPFLSTYRNERDGWEEYCSHRCGVDANRAPRIAKTCANCGKDFEVYANRAHELTCSLECRTTYYKRDRSHAWKGGLVAQNDRAFRRIDREGYAAKYEGEHRLLAARVIGRPIVRGELVICIDGNNDNIVATNLFICPDYTEFGLLKSGAVEWPSASNLETYRVNGYQRPDVIVTVHEWEHGRRPGKGGKWIKRHPQADEIIERRRAGATVRQLAEAFGSCVSAMAHTVRNRL